MKNIKFLLMIIFICLINSCSMSNRSNNYYADISMANESDDYYVVNLDTATLLNRLNVSSVFSKATYIPLETNSKSLLGRINQICTKGDTIFVLDAVVTKKVHAFLRNGNHIKIVGGIGDGPNEYSRPTSIGIIDDNFYVYDSEKKSILFFKTETLEYSHSLFIDIPEVNRYVSVVDSIVFSDAYTYGETIPFMLYSIDLKNKNKVDKWLPTSLYNKGFLDANYFTGEVLFHNTGGSVKYHHLFTDTIMELTKDGVSPYCVIQSKNLVKRDFLSSFGNNKMKSFREIREKIRGVYNIHNYIECDRYVLFSINQGNDIQTVLLNKKTLEFFYTNYLYDDITFPRIEKSISIIPVLGDEKGFYGYIHPFEMERFVSLVDEGFVNFNVEKSELSSESNPILVYYE